MSHQHHYGAGEHFGAAPGHYDESDTYDGDALDEQYLIGRAEHEAHADDGEEAEQAFWADQNEQAWAAGQDGDDVVISITVEAHPTSDTVTIPRAEWAAMTPAERRELCEQHAEVALNNAGGYGWGIASGAPESDLEDQPGTAVHEAIEALHQAESQPPYTLLELIDAYARAYLWSHGNVSAATAKPVDWHAEQETRLAEIKHRLDLVRERTGNDDGTTQEILDILDGRS